MGLKWKIKKYVHHQTGMKVNIRANDTRANKRSIPQPAFDGEEYNQACDLCCLLSHLIPISPITGCHIKSQQKSLRLLWKERLYEQFVFFFKLKQEEKVKQRIWFQHEGEEINMFVSHLDHNVFFSWYWQSSRVRWCTDYHFYFLSLEALLLLTAH